MRRACKSPLAIIAEGYARKNYKKDWQKYLNGAIGECNEPEFCKAKFARRAAGQNLFEILRFRRDNPGILRARICA